MGSFNERAWCIAGCPSCFISGIVHGQQHRSCRSWPSPRITPLLPPHLSPLWCAGWWHCHARSQLQMEWGPSPTAVNDIVHCVIFAAHLSSRLEPTGLSRSDNKRPDRVTLVPWRSGRLLVWDATCPDTFAPSHLPSATREAGAVAALAERSKQVYAALNQQYNFTPVPIETAGPFGP